MEQTGTRRAWSSYADLIRRPRALLASVRQQAGGLAAEGLFRGLARAGRLHPLSEPARHGVEVLRDIPYADSGSSHHLLDVYRPARVAGPLPVVLYLHGGGFRILSKDTHWVMGLAFARRGYVVFNINYRLAPRHPFPAAVEDACTAYTWLARNAAAYGGDVTRLVLAGESAGGNLATSLAMAACYRRTEDWARQVHDTGVVPRAVLPACAILQVSDPLRFRRRKRIHPVVMDRILEVSHAYLGDDHHAHHPGLDLADPLCALERAEVPVRPLPPFFAVVGTRDPVLDDTRRLKAALDALQVPCEAQYYPGELHAFHALVFRAAARRCWSETFRFLDQHVPAAAPAP